MDKAAFRYLNPFENHLILNTGLIWNFFFFILVEMTLQSISYSTIEHIKYTVGMLFSAQSFFQTKPALITPWV